MKILLKASVPVISLMLYIVCLFCDIGFVWMSLLGIPFGIILSNVAHELSHLAAYRILGLTWKALRIGPLTFLREDGRVCTALDWSCSLYAGGCTCVYDRERPVWQYALALLSGVLVCAVASVTLFWAAGNLKGCSSLLFALGFSFACNALWNLLPLPGGDIRLLGMIVSEKEKSI